MYTLDRPKVSAWMSRCVCVRFGFNYLFFAFCSLVPVYPTFVFVLFFVIVSVYFFHSHFSLFLCFHMPWFVLPCSTTTLNAVLQALSGASSSFPQPQLSSPLSSFSSTFTPLQTSSPITTTTLPLHISNHTLPFPLPLLLLPLLTSSLSSTTMLPSPQNLLRLSNWGMASDRKVNGVCLCHRNSAQRVRESFVFFFFYFCFLLICFWV